MDRAYAYIDGFNLYHGIKAKDWDRYLWLDLSALAGSFLNIGQELLLTKYCTSRVAGPPDRVKRQSTFIDALEANGGVRVIEGSFQKIPVACNGCGHSWDDYEEKQTDVNLAVQMVSDAYVDKYDVAFLISGDTDFIPAVKVVRGLGKRVVCLFPPLRASDDLGRWCNAAIPIGRKKLADHQLPPTVMSDGYEISRPAKWPLPN